MSEYYDDYDYDDYDEEDELTPEEEVDECIMNGGGELGAGPVCVIGGCPYWGGDGICMLVLEHMKEGEDED